MYGYYDELGVVNLLYPFTRVTVVGSSLGPMTYLGTSTPPQ